MTTLVLVEVFKIYAQDRVLRHPLTLQLILRTLPPRSGSELPQHSSPWTPAAYDVTMALKEEEESEDDPDFDVEYVEFDRCFWRPPWLIGRGPV